MANNGQDTSPSLDGGSSLPELNSKLTTKTHYPTMSPVIINIVGYAAAICMICGYLPQAIYTIRTRDTDGIAMTTFLLLGFGSIFFVIQGFMINNWPLIITNLITTISSIIVFVIKVQNDRKKKRH